MSSTFLRLELLSDQSIGRVSRIENTDVRKSGAHLRLRDVGPAIPQKDSGPEHLAMPRPGCESAIRRPTRSGRIDQATSVARWCGEDHYRAFGAACVTAIDLLFKGKPQATPPGSPRPAQPR